MTPRRTSITIAGPQPLAGELTLPLAAKMPGVVLCPALGAGKESMRDAATALAQQGVAALALDMPGHGQSGGVYSGGCTSAVLAALDSLATVPQVDGSRLALMGHSAGAREALLAAVARPDVRALVCTSCPADADGGVPGQGEDFFQRVRKAAPGVAEYPKDGPLPWLTGKEAWASRLRMQLRGERLRIDWKACMLAWAQKRPGAAVLDMDARPILFVHCEGDTVVPPLASVILYQKAASPKELMTPEGGSHDAPLTSSAVRTAWTAWLARILQAQRTHAN